MDTGLGLDVIELATTAFFRLEYVVWLHPCCSLCLFEQIWAYPSVVDRIGRT